jgi:hypothetical protein
MIVIEIVVSFHGFREMCSGRPARKTIGKTDGVGGPWDGAELRCELEHPRHLFRWDVGRSRCFDGGGPLFAVHEFSDHQRLSWGLLNVKSSVGAYFLKSRLLPPENQNRWISGLTHDHLHTEETK